MSALGKDMRPKPTFEWIDGADVTEEDIVQLARVGARAFGPTFSNHMAYGGIRFEDDPVAQERIYRCCLIRGLRNAKVALSHDRMAMQLVYAPGCANETYMGPHDSGLCTGPEWQALSDVIDVQAFVDQQLAPYAVAFAAAQARHFSNPIRDTWRTAYFVVDPSVQGQGHGKALADFVARVIEEDGRPWTHSAFQYTLPFYERCGMRILEPIIFELDIPASYTKGIRDEQGRPITWLVEYGPNAEKQANGSLIESVYQ